MFGRHYRNHHAHQLPRAKAVAVERAETIIFRIFFTVQNRMDFFLRLPRELSCWALSKLGLGAVMKKLFLANVALAVLIAAPAMAADMPIKGPPVYKAPFSWTGCYAGFNAGYIGALDRYDNSPSGAYSTIFTPAQIAQPLPPTLPGLAIGPQLDSEHFRSDKGCLAAIAHSRLWHFATGAIGLSLRPLLGQSDQEALP